MPPTNVALAETLMEEKVPHRGRCHQTSTTLSFSFVGAGCAALLLWSYFGSKRQAWTLEPINMTSRYISGWAGQQIAQPPRAWQSFTQDPLAKLAIAAIKANHRSNLLRDISMNSKATIKRELEALKKESEDEVKEEVASMDSETVQEVKAGVSKIVAKARTLAGISKPFDGDFYSLGYFDPCGFTTKIYDVGTLLFWREVEIKHGRVGMLASLGIVVGERFHPLFGGDIDVPAYMTFQATPLQNFWQAVVLAIGLPELISALTFEELPNLWKVRSDRVPGDLGFDPLGLKPTDPAAFLEMQTKELNNGRLAMIAAAGMLAQEVATGQKIFSANILDSLLSTGGMSQSGR